MHAVGSKVSVCNIYAIVFCYGILTTVISLQGDLVLDLRPAA